MAGVDDIQDVVIIGGGPGGSTLGSYLSMRGISNTIFESAIHPRPHVGESLVPSTTRILGEIGFLETMEREGFERKYGASWHSTKKNAEVTIEFSECPQEGIEQDHTYHVDRSRFDCLLLEHASRLGSDVYQGTEVESVIMDGDRVCGVRVGIAGQTIEVRAKVVVDASGRRAMLGRKFRLFRKDAQFDQFATHAWFTGVDRSGRSRGNDIHIYFLPVARGWAWQIPISDETTSVGVVVPKSEFRKAKDEASTEEWFRKMLDSNPDLAAAMKGAVRINDLSREGDYSYSMERFAGPGYLLIGDAARFVDPIFSSGVSVAMYSARFAADAIEAAVGDAMPEHEAFARFESVLRRGCDVWYEFICLYYRLLPVFTLFMKDSRYRPQLIRLLQGEVFDPAEVPVLEQMRTFVRAVESSREHLLHQYLGDVELPSTEN